MVSETIILCEKEDLSMEASLPLMLDFIIHAGLFGIGYVVVYLISMNFN